MNKRLSLKMVSRVLKPSLKAFFSSKKAYDVVIIGAGPGGKYFTLNCLIIK